MLLVNRFRVMEKLHELESFLAEGSPDWYEEEVVFWHRQLGSGGMDVVFSDEGIVCYPANPEDPSESLRARYNPRTNSIQFLDTKRQQVLVPKAVMIKWATYFSKHWKTL